MVTSPTLDRCTSKCSSGTIGGGGRGLYSYILLWTHSFYVIRSATNIGVSLMCQGTDSGTGDTVMKKTKLLPIRT